MKFLTNLNQGVKFAGIVTTILMIIVAFMQVVFRYVFQNALDWSEEVSIFLFMWACYFGMCLGMREKAHLRVDALITFLPDKTKKCLNILNYLLTILFMVIVLLLSIDMICKLMNSGQIAISIGFPLWIVWIVIPITSIVMIFFEISNLLSELTMKTAQKQ